MFNFFCCFSPRLGVKLNYNDTEIGLSTAFHNGLKIKLIGIMVTFVNNSHNHTGNKKECLTNGKF